MLTIGGIVGEGPIGFGEVSGGGDCGGMGGEGSEDGTGTGTICRDEITVGVDDEREGVMTDEVK